MPQKNINVATETAEIEEIRTCKMGDDLAKIERRLIKSLEEKEKTKVCEYCKQQKTSPRCQGCGHGKNS